MRGPLTGRKNVIDVLFINRSVPLITMASLLSSCGWENDLSFLTF